MDGFRTGLQFLITVRSTGALRGLCFHWPGVSFR